MKKLGKYILKIILITILVIGFYYCNNQEKPQVKQQRVINETENLLEIYYLDVGEADSTYIHYKNTNILIDAGNTADGKKIVGFLRDLGVDHFDIVFATHAHEDHIGGMQWIIYKFSAEDFYMPNHPAKWKSYNNLLSALEEKNVVKKEPEIDQELNLEDLKIEVLWVGHDQEDYNENSIVLKLIYKNKSFLFMSDAEENVERQIRNKDIKSDVLKVGHHGSKYASTAQFLYQVNPEYAIISVGKDNEYNHPHQVVLDKLNKMKIQTYRTDEDHTIHLISDGESIKIEKIDTDLNGGDLN